MALTISTGFVVDDAIVVTENVARFIELGETPMQAALKGARQIGFTIISITVSLLAVFIPILLMGGIIGRLFREFAVTLSVAIAVSAVVSLTLTPMMCSRLLRGGREKHGWLYNLFEKGFDAVLRLYARMLRWVLRYQIVMQIVTGLTVVATVILFVIVPKGLFPQQDTGLLMGFSQASQDISFPAMKAHQTALNEVLATDPDISHYTSFIGGGYGASAQNTGTVFVELKTKPGRKTTADDVIARLRPQLGKVAGVNLYLQAAQDVRVGGRSSRTQYQYTLQDADLDELRTWAPRIMDRLKKLPELKDVASDQQDAGLQLDVMMDRDTASRLGVTPQILDDTLSDAFGQRQVATTYTPVNQYRVVLEVKPEFSQSPDALQEIYVPTAGGGLTPLSSIARTGTSSMPLSINHQGQFPSITLSFNLAPNVALGQAIDAIHKAELEIGKPASLSADFTGTAQAFQSSIATEGWLVVAALVTVYIVLGMLYESFVHPITILSTLPSAGIGALLALILFKTDFSIIGLIGIILLIGIVKKNAIMMIDFALEVEREENISAEEAIYRACVLRFRPILMTTLSALFGGLPLAFGTGMGAELRRPLGIAIVGGLIVSQMLTLFTTPVIYLLLDHLSWHRLKRTGQGPRQDLETRFVA
jgi:multidrug efflux pump subunit AcrB